MPSVSGPVLRFKAGVESTYNWSYFQQIAWIVYFLIHVLILFRKSVRYISFSMHPRNLLIKVVKTFDRITK